LSSSNVEMKQWVALCALLASLCCWFPVATIVRKRRQVSRFLAGDSSLEAADADDASTMSQPQSPNAPEPVAAWTAAWETLSKREIYAADALGWSEGRWNFDYPPVSSATDWTRLTDNQQAAAKVFGFTIENWGQGVMAKAKGPSAAWTSAWGNLTINQTVDALNLGFDQEMWDGRVMPVRYTKFWNDLSPQEQDALSNFNWSTAAWNKKKSSRTCKAHSKAWLALWSNLTLPQIVAAKILGWYQETWDGHVDLLPPSNSKPWYALSLKEQAAAATFCWQQATWDEAVITKGKGPPPLPLCNWTLDWEGVARPAACLTVYTGQVTCGRGNRTFDPSICVPPPTATCPNPIGLGTLDGTRYAFPNVPEGDFQHGADLEIHCSENATAVDHRYPLESWGQDWYTGIKKTSHICNNGTILRMAPTKPQFFPGHPLYKPPGIKPGDLRCVPKEQVKLTQDMVQYLRWTEPRMAEAEAKAYKWIDMDAILHKKLLKEAMNKSATWEIEARTLGEFASIEDLKSVIKTLIDQRMVPRGEPMTQETCKDFEKHWLYQLENSDPFKAAGNIGFANYVPPVNKTIGFPTADDVTLETPIKFTCSYTLQKSAAGFDPYTRLMNYHYRDGCYCESRWTGGCPFRAELNPSFRTFGFDTVEIKAVSSAPGAATNALCWYMTKPANPEWGYLRSDLGYTYQAPVQNVTELKSNWLKMRKLAQSARFDKS